MALLAVTAGEGQAIALAYGEHIVAGHILVNKTEGDRALLLGLGRGTWSKIKTLWYNGEQIPTAYYRFHPGTLSTGPDDLVQGKDEFYPAGITFNRLAYVSLRLPVDTYPTVDPSAVVGRYECLLIADYDDFGREVSTGYSANPARVFADLWIKRAKRDPNRIDWGSWYDWRQYCDQTIPWRDGKTVDGAGNPVDRYIPRFEAHVVFTNAVELIDALNLVTQVAATTWQDTGSKIVFYPPNTQTDPFLFDASVIVDGTVEAYSVDRRTLPAFARVRFRDLDSDVLAPAESQWPPPELIGGLNRNGLDEASFGAMYQSQAMRLTRFLYKSAFSNYRRCSLEATGRSLAVLPGDFAKINHRATGGLTDAEVLEAEDLGNALGSRRFTLALGERNFYSDLDHDAIPGVLPVTPA